jgi:hypothetical protein
MQEVRGALRMGRDGKNGALVVLENSIDREVAIM